MTRISIVHWPQVYEIGVTNVGYRVLTDNRVLTDLKFY